MRKLWALLPVVLLVVHAACGETKVSAPSPTGSITITLPGVMKVGETQQATATALTSNGSTPITSGFKSDTPGVASVTDAGSVTGVSNGLANIYVIYNGMQGTQSVHVVPDYQGNFEGYYTVTGCTADGVMIDAGLCGPNGFYVGSQPFYGINATQSADTVNATLIFGMYATAPVTSVIAGDGSVQFTTTVINQGGIRVDAVMYVTNNRGTLGGTVVLDWTAVGGYGTGRVTGNITSGSRVSTLAKPTPIPLLTPQDLVRGFLKH